MLDAPKFLELIPRDVFINHILPYCELSELRKLSLLNKYFLSIVKQDNFYHTDLDKFYKFDINFLPYKVRVILQKKVDILLNKFFVHNHNSTLIFFCPQKCIMDFLFSNEHRAQRSLINKSHIRLLKAACRNDISRLHELVCKMDEPKKAVLRQLSIYIEYYYPFSVIAGAILLEDCKLTYDHQKLLELIINGAIPDELDVRNNYIEAKYKMKWEEKEKLILFQKVLKTYQAKTCEALSLCKTALNNNCAIEWLIEYLQPEDITDINKYNISIKDDLDDFIIQPLESTQLPVNVNSFNKLYNLSFLTIAIPNPNIIRHLNSFGLNTHGNPSILCYILWYAQQSYSPSLTAANQALPLYKDSYLSNIIGALLENGLDLRDGLLWKNLWTIIRCSTNGEERTKQILYINKYLKPLCPMKEVVEKQYNKILGMNTIAN